jgi:glycosyltransferase involved in cell wall biosynthesis
MPSPPADSPPASSSESRKILIFEPDPEGHALEWLEHLMAFVAAERPDTEIWLLAPEALCTALAEARPAGAADRIRVVALSPLERRLCTLRLLSVSAFARWWTMRRHLRRSGAEHGFFLMLDLLSLPLALGLGAGGRRRLSGILFRPSVHYGAIGPYKPSRGERLRDGRKALLYRLMLRNPALERVLSLDPFFPAHAHSHYPKGDKVVALPDPANPPVDCGPPSAPGFAPSGRIGFLLFGYLTERKGPLALLDALFLLPRDVAARVAILFAGRVDPALREQIEQRQSELARHHPDLWLRIDDRRLDQAELASLVRQCDVVLAPYQRFVGSSGVLLWAAVSGRPVLAQEFGLVGRLTRDHRLGVSVDASDPTHIAREIVRMVECGPSTFIDDAAAASFAAARSPQRFASLVLSV